MELLGDSGENQSYDLGSRSWTTITSVGKFLGKPLLIEY